MLQSKVIPIKQTQPLLEWLWQALLGLWRAWSKTLTTEAGTKRQVALRQQVAYSVVHAIPGRVRFRVSKLVRDAEYAHRLQMVAESDSNITAVRINRDAASVVFNYESKKIDFSHFVGLIQSAEEPVGQDFSIQKQKGETVQWRDGEIFSSSYQKTSSQSLIEPIAKLIILACSLAVRQAEIPYSCCLLKSKAGKPLYGGARVSRIVKLRKLQVLI